MTHEATAAESLLAPRQARAGAGETSAVSVVPDDLHTLRAVVEGTAGSTGQEFFRSFVRHLAEAIDVHYVGVCEFKNPQLARVLALWERDHVVEGREFDLTTTLAGEVLRSGLAHFPTGVVAALCRARVPNRARR
jgi:hypothetical protein